MSERRSGTYNTAKQKEFRKAAYLHDSRRMRPVAVAEGRQLLGKKFRRQISIGRYIVDFYCPEARLVIELGGASHFSFTIDEHEAERNELAATGWFESHPV